MGINLKNLWRPFIKDSQNIEESEEHLGKFSILWFLPTITKDLKGIKIRNPEKKSRIMELGLIIQNQDQNQNHQEITEKKIFRKSWNFVFKRFRELNYYDQKIRGKFARDILKLWTAVSTLLGLISSVYRDLPHWRSNQQSHNAEPKLYHWPPIHIALKRRQIN